MKKFILFLLLLSVPSMCYGKSYIDSQLKNVKKNIKYNSVEPHRNYHYNISEIPVAAKPVKIFDPGLIKLSEYKPVSESNYNAKLAKDEEVYKKQIMPALSKKTNTVNIDPYTVDFYNLYRISERIIRANNLDYINWRISVRKTEDVNAYAANVNNVVIYTALYDSFYNNDDALAFIIAHEMAHLILGHEKQKLELYDKLDKVLKVLQGGLTSKALILNYKRQLRDMEFMADTEAIILLTKAGYSPEQALGTLSYLNMMDSNVKKLMNDHPITAERIASYRENMAVIDSDWVQAGRENIYNSEVLPCKKSSDRVSIVISKSNNVTKYYEVENIDKRLTRIAYMSYKNGNFGNAIKYFEKLTEIDSGNYIPYVYIALSNKMLYDNLKQEKYLIKADKAIEKAKDMAPLSKVVDDLYKELKL
ncbi:M48 family metallopeptidase [bacterium]|nr:M48 family metallopeptidase [bacterium]